MGQTIIIILLLLITIIPVATAELNLNPVDAGAQMISKGLDAWAISIGDKAMNASSFNQTENEHRIFSMLTFTYDPFKNPWVIETRNTTAMIYTILVFLFMFSGAAYVYLHTASPSIARNIDFLVGGNLKYFHLNNYLKTLVLSIVFVAVVYMGYWLLLLGNTLLSELVLWGTLDSIVPKPDDFIMYIIMAISVLILSLFMAWRMIVIGWGAAYILILAGMYLFNPLRGIAVKTFLYILTMIYMQVILISMAGAGVMIIRWLPIEGPQKIVAYSSLTFGLVLFAFVLVVGTTIFLFFMRQGSNVIKLGI